jgi:hypothetical protein
VSVAVRPKRRPEDLTSTAIAEEEIVAKCELIRFGIERVSRIRPRLPLGHD